MRAPWQGRTVLSRDFGQDSEDRPSAETGASRLASMYAGQTVWTGKQDGVIDLAGQGLRDGDSHACLAHVDEFGAPALSIHLYALEVSRCERSSRS
jgi:hypothetical protein